MLVFKRLYYGEEGFALKFLITAIIVVIVVIALMAEFGPILWFRISTMQDAEDLAASLAADFKLHGDADQILGLAADKLRLMGYEDDEIRECVVELLPANSDQKTSIRVTVVKYANSFVISRIEQLKKLSRIATTREAPIPTRLPGDNQRN